MRLSQAIREGCKQFPRQVYWNFFSGRGCCTLAAAFVGEYDQQIAVGSLVNILTETFPVLLEWEIDPVTNERQMLYWIIKDLNDVHKWEREKIADWLEQNIERKIEI